MAEVRCPMCGKTNPEELDVCQFCGARLKPLLPSTPDDSQPNKASEETVENKPLDFEKETSVNESPDASSNLPDWLPGLDKAASDDKEGIPDWLESLRGEKSGKSTEEPTQMVTGSLSAGSNDIDWEARLGGEPQPTNKSDARTGTPKPASQTNPPDVREPIDWLDSLKSQHTSLEAGREPVESKSDKEPETGQGDNQPDWLDRLKENGIDSKPAPHEEDEGKVPGSDVPDWLSDLKSVTETSETATGENLPDWLSDMETKEGGEAAAPEPAIISENPSSNAARNETPDWLSSLKADVNAAEEQETKKEQFEATPSTPDEKEKSGPLPDWLAEIKQTPASSDATPALITGNEGPAPEEKDDVPFPMETPDWLSQLKPEQTIDKSTGESTETSKPENLDVSELPSWVQAMRPVESVVEEANATPQEDDQTAELSGPLSGLQGVLPAGPGLGPLRKPPAYSNILQVSDGQQSYANAFEQLISNETKPQAAKRTHLSSSRVWRWLITSLLIMAVGLPLTIGIPITPASTLQPPEMIAAFTFIGSLPSNAPVLMVFDYDPALSGELEAAAAPLVDHLLLQGPRLAMISTNPTGPVLVERFMHDSGASPLIARHNYQAGQQYVNLGYLAGGPSGVQYFAISPMEASPFTMDGQPAWELPPLQGIQKLSDFATIIVLTDNADSGRVWIEQTGSTISSTPILMVISAQAEPMILPYYDSGQVKGLVTGLAGGETYGQTYILAEPQTDLAQRYWSSFSTGAMIAIILIAVGALGNALAAWRARRDKPGEAA